MAGVALLTGATGFVGRQTARALAQDGVALRLVVRPKHARTARAMDGVEQVITTPDLFLEPSEWWKNACQGVDMVVHLAWYAEPGKYLTSPLNLDCLTGTLAMAKGAISARVRRFVGIGTCFEYDLGGAQDIDVTTPLAPTTPYAAAKAAAFVALSGILPQAGMEFAWCRLFYLFGAGEDRRRLVPYLHAQLGNGLPADLTTGYQLRDFLDVAAAGRKLADASQSAVQGPVNICSGQALSVRALAERIADQYGRRDLLNFGARPDNLVDPARVVGIPTPITPNREDAR